MKKLFSILLAAVMLIGSVGVTTAFAGSYIYMDFNGWHYRYYNRGEIELICYDGSAENVTVPDRIHGIPVTGFYRQNDISIIIRGHNVKRIAFDLRITELPSSFANSCETLERVTLPDSLWSVGNGAFYGCRSLTEVGLPAGLRTIGRNAFSFCKSLASVALPGKLTTIGNSAFEACTALRSVTLPASLQTLGEKAFFNCTNLKTVTVKNGVTRIGGDAFGYCNQLGSVTLPASVAILGNGVFQNCAGLTRAVLPEGLVRIPSELFYGCTALETADIPASVRFIGDYAFYNCKKLQSAALPAGLVELGDSVFRECHSLTSVSVPGGVANVGTAAFMDCVHLANVTLSPGVREIGNSAFFGCAEDLTITLPASVEKVFYFAFPTGTSTTKYFNGEKRFFDRITFERAEDKANFKYRVPVSFSTGHGEAPAALSPYLGEAITLPVLSAQGYGFNGWALGDGSYAGGAVYTVGSDHAAFTALWTARDNTVTFVTAKGVAPDAQTVTSGDKASAPAGQTAGDEYLAGWYKNADFTGAPYDFSEPVLESFTLYARWVSAPSIDVDISGDEAEGNAVIFRDKNDGDLVYATFTESGSAYVPADAEMIVTAADDMDYSGAIVAEIPRGEDMVEVRAADIVNDTYVYTPNYGSHTTVHIEFTFRPKVIIGALLIDDEEHLSQDVIDGLWILQNNKTPAVVLPEGYLIPVSDNMVGNAEDIMYLTLYPPEGYACDGSIINGDQVTTVCAGKVEYGGLIPRGNLTLNLHFYKTENYVTLTFNSVNNSSYFTQKYPKGQDAAATFEMPECPFSYSVYAFNHWQKGDDAGSVLHPGDTVDLPDTDTAYNAVWDKAYALKFRANVPSYETFSGSMETIPAYEKDDYTATVPECGFSRPGFAFVGWNTRANGRGDSYQPGDPITLTASLTLYAQWKEAFTVKLYPNFEGGGDFVRQKIPQGYGAELLSPFTREDCLLTGWTVDPGGEGAFYAPGETINPTDDMALYAQWHEHDYRFDSFIWAADETSAQVKLVCADDDTHIKYVDAEMLVFAYEAACEADAYTVYEAVYDGHSETKTLTEENSALGHDYGSPEWTWSIAYEETDGGEFEKIVSAMMAMDCGRCGTPFTWDADVESAVTAQPTETVPGETTYTATVILDGAEYTDETTGEIPALGLPADEAAEMAIDAIGEVTFTEDCRGAIDLARAVYDDLTVEEQALVGNYDVLLAAEARYAELEIAALTPAAPTGVTVTPTAENTLTVRWDAQEGATQFNVYRYNSAKKVYVYIGTTFAAAADPTQYTDKNLTAGKTYYYKVVAAYKDDVFTLVSERSPSAHAKALVTPAVPTGVTVTPTADKTLTVSWDAQEGATQFNVYRYNGAKKTYVYRGTVHAAAENPTQFADTDLTAGATYYYKVVAVTKGSGLTLVSEKSPSAHAKALGTPAVPTGVTVTPTADKTLTVSWDAQDGATQYNIYRSAGANGTYSYKGTTFASAADPTQYADRDLTAGRTYYYKVVAVTKGSGLTLVSEKSAPASGTAQ